MRCTHRLVCFAAVALVLGCKSEGSPPCAHCLPGALAGSADGATHSDAPAGPADAATDVPAPRPETGADRPGGPAPDGGAPPATGFLPCDVERTLRARCQGCHQRPPRFGAPMPLLDFADTRAPAPDPGEVVWQAMKRMVEQGFMPPAGSPGGPLTPAEKAGLLTWLGAGAPPAAQACASPGDAGAPGDARPSGPAALPCRPQHEFRAQGAAADQPFSVPLANDSYHCVTFPVPFTAAEQGIAWAPIVDDERVLHHFILYAVPPGPRPTGCNHSQRTFLIGWAPGGGNFEMPRDVGLELPDPDGWLMLELHYNNKARLTDARDRSGLALCTTQTPRPRQAGIFTFGSTAINIPPGADAHTVRGECPPAATQMLPEPLHVLWSAPHMHRLGRSFRTEIVGPGGTITISDVPVWDFGNQQAYPQDPARALIRPGDAVRTTCTYDNPTNRAVRFGESTDNEMCFDFVLAYPVDRIPPLARRCFR